MASAIPDLNSDSIQNLKLKIKLFIFLIHFFLTGQVKNWILHPLVLELTRTAPNLGLVGKWVSGLLGSLQV